MIKRCFVLLLTVLMMLTFAVNTAEAAPEKQSELVSKTRSVYQKSLRSAGVESFKGYCGTLAAHQLYHLGVTRYAEIRNGKDHFDYHVDNPISSGGYYVNAYSAEEYTLEEALNAVSANGTRNVYNILLGFQWTDTEAGGLYGHAGVITGIENGVVHMIEGYWTPMAGDEGNLIRCSIARIAEFYDEWTIFEGLIHFSKTYAGACKRYGTDLFVRPRFDISLRSQPCIPGQNDCKELRSISAGERLRVTAVLEDPNGDFYYEVEDGQQIGYIVAQTTALERTNAEELSISGYASPLVLQPGNKGSLQGIVRAEHGLVGEVEIVITDSQGKEVVSQRRVADRVSFDLSQFHEGLPLETLAEGCYTLTVKATTASACVREDALDYSYATVTLKQNTLRVGDSAEEKPQPAMAQPVKDGWIWQNGTWYYYEEDKPCNGWLHNHGVKYYLQADGSVTTGWAEIEGQQYCFSATGALCEGWLRTEAGMRYSLPDGSFADGWQIIDASLYCFDGGILQTAGERVRDSVTYTIQEDGRAVPANKE